MQAKDGTDDMHEDASFLEIDPHRLDYEWVKQPSLYMQYSTMLADANARVDSLKVALSICDSDLQKAVRANPEKYGIARISEAAIGASVEAHKDHVKAVKRLNRARHRVGILMAAVTALDHRKRALTMLVELHTSNYYSDPIPKRGSAQQMETLGMNDRLMKTAIDATSRAAHIRNRKRKRHDEGADND